MEQIQGSRKASRLSTKDDIISGMPDIVMTRILNHLPIQDAVRTSILARNWRFKWTMLTQLVFDKDFVDYISLRRWKKKAGNCIWYNEKCISRLFIHLKGPITKFFLYVPNGKVLNVKDLNHWVMFLSRKRIMEFTILNDHEEELIKLPTHLYSCLELTHLKLHNCHFRSAPPTFNGFPNLLSLDLSRVTFASGFCEIITLCPSLEILKIFDEIPVPKMKLVEIAKLKNLKMLSLPLKKLDSMVITDYEIFLGGGYFPKLEELFLSFWFCQFVGAVPRKLLRESFSSVKTLTLDSLDFNCNSTILPYAFEIIWGCPKLQTLTISVAYLDDWSLIPALSPSELNYITMGQLQLLNVVFKSFKGLKNELFLIKYLLAYTPLLQKITIHPEWRNRNDHKEKLIAMKLLRFPRASPIAEVDVLW